jgi:hypothetical protein
MSASLFACVVALHLLCATRAQEETSAAVATATMASPKATLSGVNLVACGANGTGAALPQFVGTGRCELVGGGQLALTLSSDGTPQLCAACGDSACVPAALGQCVAYGSSGQLVASRVSLVSSVEAAGSSVPSMGVYLVALNETCDDATRTGTPIQLLFRTCLHQAGGSLLFAGVDLQQEVMQLCVFDNADGNAHDRCESYVENARSASACYFLSFKDDSCAAQAPDLLFVARKASDPQVEAFGIIGILLLALCILCVMVVVVLLAKRSQRKAASQYRQMDSDNAEL